jgi:hypothetical protein
MKYIDDENGRRIVELTRRNIEVLLAKLDDPLSARGLIDADDHILVRAVETADNRGDVIAQTAAAAEGVVELTRGELQSLLAVLNHCTPSETTVSIADDAVLIRAVEDVAHYRRRAPGAVWMPSAGEVIRTIGDVLIRPALRRHATVVPVGRIRYRTVPVARPPRCFAPLPVGRHRRTTCPAD